jgi:hypothetical protein
LIDLKPRHVALIMMGCMFLITASYLVFLYGSWVQFQQDRSVRDSKLNDLLDRIPPRKDVSHETTEVQRVRSANDPPPVSSNSDQRSAGTVLRPVHEQTPQDGPASL